METWVVPRAAQHVENQYRNTILSGTYTQTYLLLMKKCG